MPSPYSADLRIRFSRLIKEGVSAREAARRFQLSPATGIRWAHQVRLSGALDIAPIGRPTGTGKLDGHVEFFKELIAQDPDITLFELRDALVHAEGIKVHHSTIARFLKRLGFTHKKSRWLPPNVAGSRYNN